MRKTRVSEGGGFGFGTGDLYEMNFFDRLKIGIAAFRGLSGIDLPPDGRSSDETLPGMMSSFNSMFGSVSPVIDPEILATLKNFWLYNPDFSQYVANIVNLGNPGHQLSIDARTDAVAEAALNRLNESASRIYTHGSGVDGLLNQYLTEVAWSGAISSEDVVNLAARRVEKVVIVPVEQIRFKYNKDLGIYEAYQKSNNFSRENSLGLIKLNPETYKYFALQTVQNSPYAKPPATAAVEAILKGQIPIMENLQYMAQKIGLMGLVDVSVTPPAKRIGNETDEEARSRATSYLARVAKKLSGNFKEGLLVHYNDQKVGHTPVATAASGVAELNTVSEQQVFSGMGAMPGFHGRTDSTTETFAYVVYQLLLAQMGNMQRPVRRRMESTYRLDLRLGGIEVDGISVGFNKAHSLDPKAEAETDAIVLQNMLTKVRAGLVSPDEGAQELGFDSWFDAELLVGSDPVQPQSQKLMARAFDTKQTSTKTLRMSFDKQKQKYIYRPEVIYLAEDDTQPERIGQGDVLPFIKKKAQSA